MNRTTSKNILKQDDKKKNYLKILEEVRPKTRKDCLNTERPCIFVSCRHNTFLDVNPENGKIKLLHKVDCPTEMETENCVLDIVDKHSALTLEEIGGILNITRERVRQIGDIACRKLKPS